MTVVNVEGPGIEPGMVKIADPGDTVRFDTSTGPVTVRIPEGVPEVVRQVRRKRKGRISRERTIRESGSSPRIRVDQVLGYAVLAVERPTTDGQAYDVGLAFCSPKDRRNWSRNLGVGIALGRACDHEIMVPASMLHELSVRELIWTAIRTKRPYVPEKIRKAVEDAAMAALGEGRQQQSPPRGARARDNSEP